MPEDTRPAPAPDPELQAVAERIEAASAAGAAPGDAAGVHVTAQDALEAGLSRHEADALARVGLDWVLDAACKQYPVLDYPEETRARGSRLAGAVLVKYDVLAWAGRWRAEFEFGMFVAGLAFQSYRQVHQSKAAPSAQDAKPPLS